MSNKKAVRERRACLPFLCRGDSRPHGRRGCKDKLNNIFPSFFTPNFRSAATLKQKKNRDPSTSISVVALYSSAGNCGVGYLVAVVCLVVVLGGI